jgi:Ca2+-binding EF-hand superfamily protein
MEDFEEFDMDGDGKIEKSEFVLRKLMLMGILHNEDVIRVEKEFDVMDVDGSGEIDMDDLRAWMEQEASRKAEEDV